MSDYGSGSPDVGACSFANHKQSHSKHFADVERRNCKLFYDLDCYARLLPVGSE